jgi:hypothetical protein
MSSAAGDRVAERVEGLRLFASTLVSFISAYLIRQRYLTEGALSSGIKG